MKNLSVNTVKRSVFKQKKTKPNKQKPNHPVT